MKHCKYEKCISADARSSPCCFITKQERGLVGSQQAEVSSHAAQHSTTPLYRALGHHAASAFPSQWGGTMRCGESGVTPRFPRLGRYNVWVNMGRNRFHFPEAPVKC